MVNAQREECIPQSPGIRARSDYIISAHTAEVNQYTTISQGLEHLQGWGLHITQHQGLQMRWPARHVVAQSSHDGHVTEYGA